MTTLTRASRYMAWLLRHTRNELIVDADGWASLSDLIDNMQNRGYRVDAEMVAQIVATDNKGRYALSPDGRYIRAKFGHSIDVIPSAPSSEPPDVLYHGTAQTSLGSIQRDGVLPQARSFVHLSDDIATALAVGSRHGEPVSLAVDAKAMFSDGMAFYPVGQHVWLTATVPLRYLLGQEQAMKGVTIGDAMHEDDRSQR